MARISHWIQNENVDFFGTNNYRQNSYAPFSEFISLNLRLLSNNDLFANLVQWFCFLICIITVSLISREYDQNRTLQLFSAFLIATIPIAILMSSNTKNDLVVGAYALTFFYFQLSFAKTLNYDDIIYSGISLGLAILTKATGYIFVLSIGLTFFIYNLIKSDRAYFSNIVYSTITTVLIGFLINLPFYIRCHFKYHNFLALNVNKGVVNEVFSFFTIVSNSLRNIAIHLGSTVELWNWYIYRIVQVLIGDKMNDPNTTYLDLVFRPPRFIIHEDHTGNMLHVLLILFSLIIGIILFKKFTKYQLSSILIPLLSILLWCLLLKWQKWPSKHLPLFLISVPYITLALDNIDHVKTKKMIISFIIIIFSYGSISLLFYNKSRPILPLNEKSIFFIDRLEGYFANRPELYSEYKQIVDKIIIEDVTDEIGMCIGGNSWEYPFWVMLEKKYNNQMPKIVHQKINNHQDEIIFLNGTKLPKYIILEKWKLDFMRNITNNYKLIVSGKEFSLYSI